MNRLMIIVVALALQLVGAAAARSENRVPIEAQVQQRLEAAYARGTARWFLQAMPKGGDLHNHLQGAVYAETWLEWAQQDGLCAHMERPALVDPGEEGCTGDLVDIQTVLDDRHLRREMINVLSVRDFVPYAGYSGSDQFFETFFRIANKPERLGDMLAAVAARAGRQNILYLELMHTEVLPELFPLVGGLELSGDVAADYKRLMASPFGAARADLVAKLRAALAAGYARRDALLGCGTAAADPGCGVRIKFIHQVVREFEPAVVFAQIALGWAAMAEEPDLVALNLVAPEHGYRALRDYPAHMAMIDHLYRSEGARNVTLHAGELALGQVRPKNLRFHIRSAIETGHALRIGHGTAIAHEDDSDGLLRLMHDRDIPVEINITSSDYILGIKGAAHPVHLYRRYGVPVIFSTDDEGVARIDLSHEYGRAVTDFGFDYAALKEASRNSLAYSFLNGASLWRTPVCRQALAAHVPLDASCRALVQSSEKAALEWELEQRFQAFERAQLADSQ